MTGRLLVEHVSMNSLLRLRPMRAARRRFKLFILVNARAAQRSWRCLVKVTL